MLYWLFYKYLGINLFRYITFRAFLSGLFSFILGIVIGPKFIKKLANSQAKQYVRDDGPRTHLKKEGTPTMGGGLIIGSVLTSTVLFADITNPYVISLLFVLVAFGFIGLVDDFLKIKYKNSKGLSGKLKLLFQFIFALLFYLGVAYFTDNNFNLSVPFFKDIYLDLGIFTGVFVILVIVGSSNAVNLTDGLDGLAIGPVITTLSAFLILSYISGNKVLASYLYIPYINGVGEITIFLAAVIMAGLSFLWFNTYPAQVFMGDIGALSLGAVIGAVAVLIQQELLLLIIGGIFVMEALSVIIQVFSYKLTRKRVFRMAPIHHHFELKGWAEPKVIVRFWIISIILAIIGLITIKIR